MISVVIPAYNCEKTIEACIESVLSQTRIDLICEIIVVDDGSMDNTASLIENRYKYNSLVCLIRKTNGGVSSARNTGIQNAKGDWIALLDSDDVWKENKIDIQWNKIKQYPHIKFIGTNRNNENYSGGKKIDETLRYLTLYNLIIKNWPHTSTVLIHKSVFQEIGMFNENMKYAEDGEMWNRVAIKYGIYYVTISCEIAGNMKRQYGENGLSANLQEMYKGNVRNLKLLKQNENIGTIVYYVARAYFLLKHIRRVVISKII